MYEWPKFDNGKPQLSLRKEVPCANDEIFRRIRDTINCNHHDMDSHYLQVTRALKL